MSGNWKGSNTSTSTAMPNMEAYQQYSNLLNRAAGVASTPYQGYGGEEVAPINEQQQTGVSNINANAGFAQPYVTSGAGMIGSSGAPISAADIERYQNPYTNDVVAATEADFAHQNAVGQQGVIGNAAAQGALGGNRVGVAQALTAEGQTRAQAPVIAGLRSSSYQQALMAAQAERQRQLAAGTGLVGAGVSGQNAGLQGATAQFGAGTALRTAAQEADTQRMTDYYRQQGYPFQVAQWLAGMQTAVGSQMGGQSTTEGPTPSMATQIAGLGIAGASFLKRGGRVGGFGPVRRNRASGGYNGPWGGVDTWVPSMTPVHGKGPPAPPQAGRPQGGLTDKQMQQGLGRIGSGLSDYYYDNFAGGSSSNPLPGLDASDYGEGYERGGRVGYATRGSVWDEGTDPFQYDNVPDTVPTMGGVGASEPAASFGERFGAAPLRDVSPEAIDKRNYIRDYYSNRGASPDAERALERGWVIPPEEVDPQVQEALKTPLPRSRPPGLGPQDEEEPSTAMAYADQGPIPAGVRAINRVAPAPSDEGDGSALSYASPPTAGVGPPPQLQPEQSFLERLGVKMTPSLRQGLLQAGLAMMATHRGGPGSFLGGVGEGAQAGVAAYNQSENLAHREAVEQQKMAREDYWKGLPYTQMTAAQKAQIEKEYKPTWGKIRTEFDPDTGLQREIMGWIDPNKKAITELPPAPVSTPAQPAATPPSPAVVADQGIVRANAAQSAVPYDYKKDAPYIEKGFDVPEPAPTNGRSATALKTEAESYLQTGKLPKVSVGKSPVAVLQQQYRNAVQNYAGALAASRGLTPEQTAMMWRQAPGMLRFVLGPDGRSTVSLGTAVRHLETLRSLSDDWNKNGGAWSPTTGAIRAQLSRQFGDAAVTNLEAAGRIVGPEIVKAIGVAGAGTAGEREAMEKSFSPSATVKQISGGIVVTQRLLGGQLEGKKRQAAAAGVSEDMFKNLVGEKPYEILTTIDMATGKGGGGGGPPQASIDMLKADPSKAAAFDAKYGPGSAKRILGQ